MWRNEVVQKKVQEETKDTKKCDKENQLNDPVPAETNAIQWWKSLLSRLKRENIDVIKNAQEDKQELKIYTDSSLRVSAKTDELEQQNDMDNQVSGILKKRFIQLLDKELEEQKIEKKEEVVDKISMAQDTEEALRLFKGWAIDDLVKESEEKIEGMFEVYERVTENKRFYVSDIVDLSKDLVNDRTIEVKRQGEDLQFNNLKNILFDMKLSEQNEDLNEKYFLNLSELEQNDLDFVQQKKNELEKNKSKNEEGIRRLIDALGDSKEETMETIRAKSDALIGAEMNESSKTLEEKVDEAMESVQALLKEEREKRAELDKLLGKKSSTWVKMWVSLKRLNSTYNKRIQDKRIELQECKTKRRAACEQLQILEDELEQLYLKKKITDLGFCSISRKSNSVVEAIIKEREKKISEDNSSSETLTSLNQILNTIGQGSDRGAEQQPLARKCGELKEIYNREIQKMLRCLGVPNISGLGQLKNFLSSLEKWNGFTLFAKSEKKYGAKVLKSVENGELEEDQYKYLKDLVSERIKLEESEKQSINTLRGLREFIKESSLYKKNVEDDKKIKLKANRKELGSRRKIKILYELNKKILEIWEASLKNILKNSSKKSTDGQEVSNKEDYTKIIFETEDAIRKKEGRKIYETLETYIKRESTRLKMEINLIEKSIEAEEDLGEFKKDFCEKRLIDKKKQYFRCLYLLRNLKRKKDAEITEEEMKKFCEEYDSKKLKETFGEVLYKNYEAYTKGVQGKIAFVKEKRLEIAKELGTKMGGLILEINKYNNSLKKESKQKHFKKIAEQVQQVDKGNDSEKYLLKQIFFVYGKENQKLIPALKTYIADKEIIKMIENNDSENDEALSAKEREERESLQAIIKKLLIVKNNPTGEEFNDVNKKIIQFNVAEKNEKEKFTIDRLCALGITSYIVSMYNSNKTDDSYKRYEELQRKLGGSEQEGTFLDKLMKFFKKSV